MTGSHAQDRSMTIRNTLLVTGMAITACWVSTVGSNEAEPGLWIQEASVVHSAPPASSDNTSQRGRGIECQPLRTPDAPRMSCW